MSPLLSAGVVREVSRYDIGKTNSPNLVLVDLKAKILHSNHPGQYTYIAAPHVQACQCWNHAGCGVLAARRRRERLDSA